MSEPSETPSVIPKVEAEAEAPTAAAEKYEETKSKAKEEFKEESKEESKEDNKKRSNDNKQGNEFKKQKRERESKVFGPRPTLYDKEGNEIQVEPRKPKRKVAMMIGYCGTGYHGMQLNPPQKTIEGDLFDALVKAGAISKANSTDIKKNAFMRAARTDKGVHAAGNVVSLKVIYEDDDNDIVERTNSFLPEQIRVWGIERTNKGFDCRKLCSSRIYEYLLPTYSLLPPKPTSILGKKIEEYRKQFPGGSREDAEGDKWWDGVRDKLLEQGITEEQILKAQLYMREHGDESIDDENFKFIKNVKSIENTLRRSYRISDERLKIFEDCMKQYEGHHNFHNFTIGKSFKDPSANRYIMSTTISKPFLVQNTEWVSIKIHGQSFMLHQIRKMIGMASLIVRTKCPISRVVEAFKSVRINVPKAPALGLLLECPVYEGFNTKLQKFGYNEINFDKYSDKMLEFKKKFIYDKIYDEEIKENTFHGFYGFIDNFNGEPIFDFLTAKGITENLPIKEIAVPNDKEGPAIEE